MANVMVGCKLPSGFIMELVKPGNLLQPCPTGLQVVLKGSNTLRIPRQNSAHAFATTMVDEKFATEWFKLYADSKLVTSGAIFMEKDKASFDDHAKDGLQSPSGFEPLDLNGDPRMQLGIEVDKDHAKRLGATLN